MSMPTAALMSKPFSQELTKMYSSMSTFAIDTIATSQLFATKLIGQTRINVCFPSQSFGNFKLAVEKSMKLTYLG
jgi:hypothetical protein